MGRIARSGCETADRPHGPALVFSRTAWHAFTTRFSTESPTTPR
ncbi:DUF397 domain-containing protein [Actinomadura alba]|uniref:DUF397 domain-containing protein n=1 Tax=Actinomadura alba TaxID=406431 RepID=A0ABR7LTQ6_9ACTN|nr:DUF397 domain-containing protein [Actinomadura alba]